MADRTVTTRLVAKVTDYVSGLKAADKATKGVTEELVDAAKAGKAMGAASAKAGAESAAAFRIAEASARKLDGQIDETTRSIRDLAREIAQTGDVAERAKLAEKLKVEFGKQRGQVKLRKLIDFDDSDAAKQGIRWGAKIAEGIGNGLSTAGGPIIRALSNIFGTLPPPAQAAIGAGVIAGVISVSPMIGAAISGAVIGGIGIGGVVGGIAAAARDPRVKAEAKLLGDDLSSMLDRSAGAFVPATLKGIGIIRGELKGFEPYLKAIFTASARFVEPLVRGAMGLLREALPGVMTAINRAKPVIDVIADRMPKIGRAIKDALGDISGDSRNAAAGVDLILEGLGGVIRISGQVIGFLADMFRGVVMVADAALTVGEVLGGWNPLISGKLEETRGRVDHLKGILNETGDAGKDAGTKIGGGFEEIRSRALTAAEMVDALKTAFDRLFGIQMSADRALIAYKKGLRELKEELATGTRTLDINTQAGQDNATAMLDQIDKAAQIRQSNIDGNMTIEEANQKYDAHLRQIRATALQMGYTKTEVDRLIAAYRAIPKKAETTVTADTGPAMLAALKLRQYLKNIPDEVVNIAMRITGQKNAAAAAHAIQKQYNRWGGLYEHAQEGLLREAHVASPMGPARYAYAEPATGGEAFIPRNGDMDRSRSIWEYVGKNWLGARPGGDGAMAAQRVQVDVVIRAEAGANRGVIQEIVRGLRYEVQGLGGNVQAALGQSG